MLTVPGPLPISPIQRPDESNLFLRVNQKVAGEILQVSNEQVVLSIQGVQVVARLTTPEQMTELIDRRFAQFVVKEFNPNNVLLQLVGTNQPVLSTPQMVSQQETDFLNGLIKQMGVKPDENVRLLVQQMIGQGIPVSSENIDELQTALNALGRWGQTEINLAVQLKAYGLQVTSESIQLLAKAPAEVTQTVSNLLNQLTLISTDKNLPVELREMLATAIRVLSNGVVDGNQPATSMVQQLKNVVTLLGKSIENEVLRTTPDSNELERGLIVLNQLRNQLASRGFSSVTGEIDKLNDFLRLVHLPNAESNDPKIQNQWFRLEIPVHFSNAGNQPVNEEMVPARLRIAREKDDEGNDSVNPDYTRVVLQMDIAPEQVIEVDLSIVTRQIGISITTTDDETRNAAIDELDSLKHDLNEMGYTTRYSTVETGPIDHQSPTGTQLPAISIPDGSINLEV